MTRVPWQCRMDQQSWKKVSPEEKEINRTFPCFFLQWNVGDTESVSSERKREKERAMIFNIRVWQENWNEHGAWQNPILIWRWSWHFSTLFNQLLLLQTIRHRPGRTMIRCIGECKYQPNSWRQRCQIEFSAVDGTLAKISIELNPSLVFHVILII